MVWTETLKKVIYKLGSVKKTSKAESEYIRIVTEHEPTLGVLSAILTIQIATDKQLQNCLFSTSGLLEIDDALNAVKATVLEYFNEVLSYISTYSKAVLSNNFCVFAKDSGVQQVLSSIFVFCENVSFDIIKALEVKALAYYVKFLE